MRTGRSTLGGFFGVGGPALECLMAKERVRPVFFPGEIRIDRHMGLNSPAACGIVLP